MSWPNEPPKGGTPTRPPVRANVKCSRQSRETGQVTLGALMSLFGSIQIANNALFAAQTGLQVTSNNIANANTPGYLRQRVVQNPAPTQLVGTLPLGLGVEVAAIVQQTDRFLTERLRGAVSDLAQSETQENVYLQLEAIIGELGEADLSTSLNQFFAAIHNVLNQPEDRSLRNLAVLQGGILADDFRRLSQRLSDMRSNVNDEIAAAAGDINRLLEKVAELNVQIVMVEGGGSSAKRCGRVAGPARERPGGTRPDHCASDPSSRPTDR